jgi:hypothetical protein
VIEAEQMFESSGSDAGYDALAPELPNVRAALTNAVSAGGDEALAVAAARLFSRVGLENEGMSWLEAALQSVSPFDVRSQSRIWSSIAYLAGNTGGARAFDAAERSVELSRLTGDRELIAWALTQFATAAIDKLARPLAEAALAEAQRLFGPDPLPHQRARILGVRLQIARVVGDLPLALKISTELRELYLRLGNEGDALRTALNHAETLHASGDTQAAIALAHATLAQSTADRFIQGTFLLNLTASEHEVSEPRRRAPTIFWRGWCRAKRSGAAISTNGGRLTLGVPTRWHSAVRCSRSEAH